MAEKANRRPFWIVKLRPSLCAYNLIIEEFPLSENTSLHSMTTTGNSVPLYVYSRVQAGL